MLFGEVSFNGASELLSIQYDVGPLLQVGILVGRENCSIGVGDGEEVVVFFRSHCL